MAILCEPIQLARNLYLVYYEYPHRNAGNVYAITSLHGTTLIDCESQSSFDQLQQNLSSIDVSIADITQIIATHGDFDHVQGFHKLLEHGSKANMFIHEQDWKAVIQGDRLLTKSYIYRQNFIPLPPDRCALLKDNQQIEAGDYTLQVLHTPGHSLGSICLLGEIDNEVWLFASDTIGGTLIDFQQVGSEVFGEYINHWQQSLHRLSQLQFDWVVTGHDPHPISRAKFDFKVENFGGIMNPWLYLDKNPAPGCLNISSWMSSDSNEYFSRRPQVSL